MGTPALASMFHDLFCVFGHGVSFSCDEPDSLGSVRIVSAAAARHSARWRSKFARCTCCPVSKRRERRKRLLTPDARRHFTQPRTTQRLPPVAVPVSARNAQDGPSAAAGGQHINIQFRHPS